MIVASDKIGVKVMMELCQHVLDSTGMPDEWKTRVIVPIFKEKGDMMSCGSYRRVKLLQQGWQTFFIKWVTNGILLREKRKVGHRFNNFVVETPNFQPSPKISQLLQMNL